MRGLRGGTPRNPDRRTDGATVAKYAELLGTPLLPWQRYVADVAGEIDPETGTYFYDTVVLSTPRQCGKSTLVDTEDVRNCMWGPDRFVYYLAQTGKDAGDHFKKLLKRLQSSPLAPIARKPYLGMGNLSQSFINGSVIMPKSITKVAGHGVQGDRVTLDEAFSLSLETGNTILDGFIPTTTTRLKATGVLPQLWITSTEGTAESTFFNKRLDDCRAGDIERRTCWFDFGLPDDADPENLSHVMQWHPAAGLLWDRAQLADFRAKFKGNAAGWARAFANRRDMGITDRVIAADLWEATACPAIDPATLDGAPVTLGVAVDVDATHTSIAAGITNQDGTITVQLVEILDGTGYTPVELERLAVKYHAPVIMDQKGTGAALYDQLAGMRDQDGQPRYTFCDLSPADYLTIGQAFVSGLTNKAITHAADDDLDDSAANSGRTWSGDAWRVTRRKSTGLTSPLEACMLAAWGAGHRPEDTTPAIV